ncbi:MAG: IS982 family transposase [Alphaproteobacteria bacterium]|nr:IS982 family transposase [Alphaproteobacteria bacterium]
MEAKALSSVTKRNREGYLSLSEMLFIEVFYHFSPYKDFKHYYLYGICQEHRSKFKKLPCYQRFVALKKQLFMPLTLPLHSVIGEETGIYFADSTPLKTCRNPRISNHRVFKGLAKRGKSTMGWFFGFKLHLVINRKGQLMAVKITAGNADDRKALPSMVRGLKGKCFADKGYIGKDVFKALWEKSLHLVTGIRKTMKHHLMPYIDKVLLRKRFIIETVFGVLKTDMNLEHSRHRSPTNAFVNIIAALVAYSYKINKPKIRARLIES